MRMNDPLRRMPEGFFILFEAALRNSSSRFAGSFPPMLRFGTLEIHKVFLRIPYLALTKNLSANLRDELRGPALFFAFL